ncbi:MAG: glycosyltransferase [Clostridia bacterium]|nr:glycosyltransferase [Clostridia bacterium]
MISVIVPIYKCEKYLEKCIESIVNQTYKDLEIILVDDGSPDGCAEICDQWARKDERIIVIHKENGGVSSARNTGIDIAKGEFLYFVDADDYIELELCSKVMACFNQQDTDIVVFDANIVDINGMVKGSTETLTQGVIDFDEALLLLMSGKINSYAWNKIYRRHVFDDVRFPIGRLWEDVATCYKLFMKSTNVYCLPERLYNYFQRGESIIHNINVKTLQDIFHARYECYENCRNIGNKKTVKSAFALAVIAARRLYDRNLWEKADTGCVEKSMSFLEKNKEYIVRNHVDIASSFLLCCPRIYKLCRVAKHLCGNITRYLRRIVRKV